jgi:hypothetical protein
MSILKITYFINHIFLFSQNLTRCTVNCIPILHNIWYCLFILNDVTRKMTFFINHSLLTKTRSVHRTIGTYSSNHWTQKEPPIKHPCYYVEVTVVLSFLLLMVTLNYKKGWEWFKVKLGTIMHLKFEPLPNSYIPSAWKPYTFIYSKYNNFTHSYTFQLLTAHSYIRLNPKWSHTHIHIYQFLQKYDPLINHDWKIPTHLHTEVEIILESWKIRHAPARHGCIQLSTGSDPAVRWTEPEFGVFIGVRHISCIHRVESLSWWIQWSQC